MIRINLLKLNIFQCLFLLSFVLAGCLLGIPLHYNIESNITWFTTIPVWLSFIIWGSIQSIIMLFIFYFGLRDEFKDEILDTRFICQHKENEVRHSNYYAIIKCKNCGKVHKEVESSRITGRSGSRFDYRYFTK